MNGPTPEDLERLFGGTGPDESIQTVLKPHAENAAVAISILFEPIRQRQEAMDRIDRELDSIVAWCEDADEARRPVRVKQALFTLAVECFDLNSQSDEEREEDLEA